MTQLEGLHTDLANSAVNRAYFERMIEGFNADRRYEAATAISDLSFAWKILEHDVDSGDHQFVPDTDSNRTPISKDYALWTEQDEGCLVSITVGSRVLIGDAELELRASGPKAKNMSQHFYELDDPLQEYSSTDQATKLHLPYSDFARIKFAEKASTLVNFLDLSPKKRDAIRRYDVRHRSIRC